MDKTITLAKPINLPVILRQAGYHPLDDARVRPFGNSYYPRFHLHANLKEQQLKCSLHLDQKQHTIDLPGLKRHAGESQGTAVQAELGRIERWISYAEML
jgi:hypothetical protein